MLSLYLGQVAKFFGAWLAVCVIGQVLRHAIRAGSSWWMAVLACIGLMLVYSMGGTVLDTLRARGIAQDERIRMRIRGQR